MTKCYKCGEAYSGYSCPTCSIQEKLDEQNKQLLESQERTLQEQDEALREQREAIESAVENARAKTEEALAEAVERQREISQEAVRKQKKIASEGWKLEADAKADRAYELYDAGLYQEAIKLCLEAIGQDPGNIYAYRFAGWSYEALGESLKAEACFKKQISLLKLSQNSGSPKSALLVLRDILGIKDNEDLVQSFIDASEEFTYFSCELLNELMKRSLYTEAYNLYKNTIQNAEALSSYAYGIELEARSSNNQQKETDRLRSHLKSVPFTERNNVLSVVKGIRSGTIFMIDSWHIKEFNELTQPEKDEKDELFSKFAIDKIFSKATLDKFQELIQERYEEWTPEINSELNEKANREGEYAASNTSVPKISGWVVGIAVVFICDKILDLIFNKPSGSVAFLAFIVVVGIGIGSGMRTASFLRQSIIERKRDEVKSEATAHEEKLRSEAFQRTA